MTQATCPTCNAKLGLKTHTPGAYVSCPKCQTKFVPKEVLDELPEPVVDQGVQQSFEVMTEAESPPPLRRRRRFYPFTRSDEPSVGWGYSAGSAFFGLCALLLMLTINIISFLAVAVRNQSGPTLIVLIGLTFAFSLLGTIWGLIAVGKENNGLGVAGMLVNIVLLVGSGGICAFLFSVAAAY